MANPWKVDSIQAFLCFKCPECEFDTKEEYFFQDHALKNHLLSHALFDDRCLKLFNKETKSRSRNGNLTEKSSKRPRENIECAESEAKKAKNDSSHAAEASQNTTNNESENTKSVTQQKSTTTQKTNKNINLKKDFVQGIPKNLKAPSRICSDLYWSEYFKNSADLRDGIREQLKCVICDKNGQTYDTKNDVWDHVVLDHIGENPSFKVKCYDCNCDAFMCEIRLYGLIYECPKCPFVYNFMCNWAKL